MVFFLVFLSLTIIFSPWFSFEGTLSSGDWPYLFTENIKEFSFFPELRFLWLAPYYQIPTKILVQYLGISWEFSERLLWFWPFLGISIASSYYLTRSWIGVLIYAANTYILMLVGGGQMGIAMAYSIVPFVLKQFMEKIDFFLSSEEKFKIQNSKFFRKRLVLGLPLALLIMFDPRVAYIILIAILIYFLFSIIHYQKRLLNISYLIFSIFILPIVIATIINSYWIIPLFREGAGSVIESFDTPLGFEYFSFADFSHAFSLLHPNWPENIFGKTYFMKAEFILLPILAYSSLLFLKISNVKTQNSKLQLKSQNFSNNLAMKQFSNETILFFALLGIIGAFLAKGANPPFGEINQWLFQYFPGMNIFRDPTKFYVLIVLSYSVLIPFSVYSIYNWLKLKVKSQKSKVQLKIQNFLPNLFLLFTILYLIFLIRPAVLGKLGGTFKPHKVPQEYLELKKFIVNQEGSFNTLWIPSVQRYGFRSKNHKAISADQIFGTTSISRVHYDIREEEVSETIKKLNVKYIIVPYDSQMEIFIKDREYDNSLYRETLETLQKIAWVEQTKSFGNIILFEVVDVFALDKNK